MRKRGLGVTATQWEILSPRAGMHARCIIESQSRERTGVVLDVQAVPWSGMRMNEHGMLTHHHRRHQNHY
jgi:hypothetical protein